MSIVRLNKITLCGLLADKSAAIGELQSLGCVHLISLRPTPREPENAPSGRADAAYEALRWLRDAPRKRRPLRHDPNFEMDTVVSKILNYRQRLREATDRRDFLQQRIQNLEPWGDFNFPPTTQLAGRKLWFYTIPVNQLHELQTLELPWQMVGRDSRHARVVVIHPEEPPAGLLPVPRTHTGARSLGELRLELEAMEVELDHLQGRREAYTRYILLLTQHLAQAEDRAQLHQAVNHTRDEGSVFAVQGWAPLKQTAALQGFAEQHRLALLVEAPTAEDRPPTLLENPPLLQGGEDLVRFYQTPGYRDWDPSAVVFCSFVLFFAMILADSGYALLLGLIIAYYWKTLGASASGQRFRRLAVVGIAASLVYGILVGSYFGFTPAPGSLAGHLAIIDLNHFDNMMRLSIIIGALHLCLANGVRAHQQSPFPGNAAPIGWILVIIGGVVAWLGLPTVGTVVLVGGVYLLSVFASQRPVHDWKSALLRLLDSLKPLTDLSKMFGDVLSYLRLFALGLASASLAVTFNQLAADVRITLPGLGVLLSLLILILGHLINLGLGIISGFVHGLRLNLIEFFNWGLSEEGYPFQAFAKKEIKHE